MDGRNGSPNRGLAGAEPVRSRWTPKPEQILILESIFNSGMVNPPKDETVRIRKLLEKFGSVGDANVFYWFQNRRSRSRRRQRQLQAAGLAADPGAAMHARQVGGAALYEPTSTGILVGDDGGADDLFFSRQMGFMENLLTHITTKLGLCLLFGSRIRQLDKKDYVDLKANDLCFSAQLKGAPSFGVRKKHHAKDYFEAITSEILSSPTTCLNAGTITVFINGIPSEVPRGPIDLRAMFGQNVMLVHSSGELLPINEYGILLQSLQMGESYFLVSFSKQLMLLISISLSLSLSLSRCVCTCVYTHISSCLSEEQYIPHGV
ncbi:unnamed protein product, partial [Musa acuminata subsp. burmannicoides]